MVKVHVWLPHGTNVGHTALTVRDRYVSFWPEDGAAAKDVKVKRSHPGRLMQSLNEDIAAEGLRQPVTIELPNLDEEQILLYLASLEDNIPRYQLAQNNCSHIVAQALMEGAKCQPSFTPNAGKYGWIGKVLGQGIWTPDQVLKFAEELRKL